MRKYGNCNNCKFMEIEEGFVRCSAPSKQIWDIFKIESVFSEIKRCANGFDLALEYGKFRQDCPFKQEKIGFFSAIANGLMKRRW